MPAKDELQSVYSNKSAYQDNVGQSLDTNSYVYFSSSETTASVCWGTSMSNGGQYCPNYADWKDRNYPVRAVRRTSV